MYQQTGVSWKPWPSGLTMKSMWYAPQYCFAEQTLGTHCEICRSESRRTQIDYQHQDTFPTTVWIRLIRWHINEQIRSRNYTTWAIAIQVDMFRLYVFRCKPWIRHIVNKSETCSFLSRKQIASDWSISSLCNSAHCLWLILFSRFYSPLISRWGQFFLADIMLTINMSGRCEICSHRPTLGENLVSNVNAMFESFQ